MSQHLLSLKDDQLAIIDRALTDLEAHLAPLAVTDEEQAPNLALRSAPPSRGRAGTQAVLATLDPLRMRLQRLQHLAQHARHAEIILVNDALNRRLMAHACSMGLGTHLEQQALRGEVPIVVA